MQEDQIVNSLDYDLQSYDKTAEIGEERGESRHPSEQMGVCAVMVSNFPQSH